MTKAEKKFIRVILIIIATAAGILILKINNTPEYDPDLYARVYGEYRSVMGRTEEVFNDENNNDNDNNNQNKKSNHQVYLIEDSYFQNNNFNNESETYVNTNSNTSNRTYTIEGEIMIPKLKLVYPVINETTVEYLKIAPTKLAGPNMNEIGNYCIAGHNYQNNMFFSKLSQLDINDQVNLTSKDGKQMSYTIYAMYEVNENDLSCTEQNTNGNIEATLITCTTQKNKRLILKCRVE